jgi:tRNA(fMet)-specific endonuclease VapC
MPFLLDSNMCIQHLRGKSPRITDRLLALPSGEAVICSVVRAELRYGVLRSASPTQELARLDRFLSILPSLPFDDGSAEQAALIRANLAKRGTPIGPHDVMIAGIALANELTLVTHNTAEFGRIQHLRVDDWEAH